MDEVYGLFPVPFMRCPKALPAAMLTELVARFSVHANRDNNSSPNLTHTEMLRPDESPLFARAAELVLPKLADFGVHLLGERLTWSMKEMWVNVMDAGGRQAMHNHANSFISGVIYLTPTHPGSQTVFMKSPGGTSFIFKNDHPGVTPGPYSADKWISPAPEPGDLVLFPSYVLHAVPPNQGARRITLAFNALPSHVDSWGYQVRFAG